MKTSLKLSAALWVIAMGPAAFAQVNVSAAATPPALPAPSPAPDVPAIPPVPQINAGAGANAVSHQDVGGGSVQAGTAAADAGTRASASLDEQAVLDGLQHQTMATRNQFVDEIDARLDASRKAQAEAFKSVRSFKGETRTKVNASVDQVKGSEKALKRSLKAFRKAPAEKWDDARSRLATDYKAYINAVTRMEMAVKTGAHAEAEAQP